MRELSAAIQKLTGKPEQYIMVSIQQAAMMFARSEEPCAFLTLRSIGAIGGDKNKMIASEIMAITSSKLGVDRSRTYMSFHDAARSDFGWNGSTFA
jgi:phenylpyruvate tautomerase PptA (4-oxalocrotonate tautomerase family)